MYRLTATYKIKPQVPFRVKRAKDDQLVYAVEIGRFSVEVTLVRNGGASHKEAHEQYEVRTVEEIKITVSGQEDCTPPDVARDDRGGKDWTARRDWFQQRVSAYHQVALSAANRVMRFFKYDMHTHLLQEFSLDDIDQSILSWTGDDGQNLDPGIRSVRVYGIGPATLGERDFTINEDNQLQRALETDLSIETFQEFMSDAQTSILRGKTPRAVMEMAIVCETAVRQAFFAKETAAGAAFEYLEDKARIPVKVIDLIDGAAKQAFGESFKDIAPDKYQNIDFLFRCRNKVAHRGENSYRDDKGKVRKVTPKTLHQWWSSVMGLMEWLADKRP